MIKIFAHRGYVINENTQNSIESLNDCVKNNFAGVEFDVWFLNEKLLISHDNPSQGNLNSLPKFRDYFSHGNKIKYWIDFKNLDEKNAESALKLAKKDLESCQINLRNVYFAPFIERLSDAILVYEKIRNIFGGSAQIMAVCEKIPADNLQRYYQDLKKNDIRFLSIMHENINENFVKIFRDIEIFAWTVNDLERLKELNKFEIKNCTSDIITPKMAV